MGDPPVGSFWESFVLTKILALCRASPCVDSEDNVCKSDYVSSLVYIKFLVPDIYGAAPCDSAPGQGLAL